MNPQVVIEERNGKYYVALVFGATPQDEGSEIALALSAKEYAILQAGEVLSQVVIEERNGKYYVALVFGATPQDEGSEIALALSAKEYAILQAGEISQRSNS